MSGPGPGGPLKMSANRLSMLSAPKHRKKYKGGVSFASAELAKMRSQNLLEKAATTTIVTPVDKGKGGGGDASSSGDKDSTNYAKTEVNRSEGGAASTIKSNVKTTKNVVPQPRPLTVAAKKLWKMPEHFVKLLKPEENTEVTDTVSTAPKQSFAESMKKNVTNQSRLYGGGGVRGRKSVVKNSLEILSISKVQPQSSSSPRYNEATIGAETSAITDNAKTQINHSTSASTNTPVISNALSGSKVVRVGGTGPYIISNRNNSCSPPRSTRESRNAAIAAAAASYTKNNTRLSTPSSVNLNRNQGVHTGMFDGNQTANSSLGLSTRAMNRNKRNHGTQDVQSTTTSSTTFDSRNDNAFTRFTSTGKTRTFGNATLASRQKAESNAGGSVNKATTRGNFSAARPSTRATPVRGTTTGKGNHLLSRSAILEKSNSLPATTFSESSDGNMEPESKQSSALSSTQSSREVKQKASSDPASSAAMISKGAISPAGRANVGDSDRSSSESITTIQNEVGRSSAINSDGNLTKGRSGVLNVSPRYASTTQSTRMEISKVSPRTDSVGSATSVSRSTSLASVSPRTTSKNMSGTRDRGAEDSNELVTIVKTDIKTFQSLSSYQTSSVDNPVSNIPLGIALGSSAITGVSLDNQAHSVVGSATEKTTLSVNTTPPLTPKSTSDAPTVVEVEEDVVDEAASAAAIELRNARRRFRLSRDAAAAAAENKSSRRREFSFVAPRRISNNVDSKTDALGSPGQSGRKGINSPVRKISRAEIPVAISTSNVDESESPKKQPPALPNRVDVIKSCVQKSVNGLVQPHILKKRVRFADEIKKEEKLNYAALMKPKVVIRSKPPLGPARFDTPPPRNVDEALLFSKLKAENLKAHEENMRESSNNRDVSTPSDSVRSDMTVTLSKDERDEYLTFDKESFVF
jgi:hypothetical protein